MTMQVWSGAQRAEVIARQSRSKRRSISPADTFEAEILRVINTVSAAAPQLQQNAKSMSSTASETDRQSKLVQDAPEQATETFAPSRTRPRSCRSHQRDRPAGQRRHRSRPAR
jgi:hypothetical protein